MAFLKSAIVNCRKGESAILFKFPCLSWFRVLCLLLCVTLCTFAVALNCYASIFYIALVYPADTLFLVGPLSTVWLLCVHPKMVDTQSTVNGVSATCPGNDTWLNHTLANSGIKVTVCNLILVQKSSFYRETFKDEVCTGDSKVFLQCHWHWPICQHLETLEMEWALSEGLCPCGMVKFYILYKI